uniref:Uncharacterized protein n=1 Tax=Myotis myotis TaxID=51298 RepID=A0A7J7T5T4_MYOMY|nr:hypothetical protein mMyoMyo1_009188 [Myotis myotis]
MDFAAWARLAPRKLEATQGKATTSQKLCSPGIPSFLLPWTRSFGEAARAPEAPQDAWALPGAPLGAPSTSVLWAPEPSGSWWRPAGVAQWLSIDLGTRRSQVRFPVKGTCPGCRLDPQCGACRRQPTHDSLSSWMFLSLSLSLSLPL